MIQVEEVKKGIELKDYNLYPTLALPLRELLSEASFLTPKLSTRKIWMVNSTSRGGGVAEMMPAIVNFLRQLNIECDWVVAGSDNASFFSFTKKIHNLIHGEGSPEINREEKEVYESENKKNSLQFLPYLKENDIVVIHDPQPLPMARFIKEKLNVKIIWRCHIGLDTHLEQTKCAWSFLHQYTNYIDKSVFSAAEYIPGYLSGRASIMHPTIDPLDHKNRDLPIHKIVGILCNSNLVEEYHPVLTPAFTETAKRLQPDGSFQSPLMPSESGLLYNTNIVQVSRWDKLKGFEELMDGFIQLKTNQEKYAVNERNLRQLQLMELVLAGPDPDFVADDPEGKEILNQLTSRYMKLHPALQKQIVLLKLPMSSRKHNELIVNCLQRVASIVIQNSLKEGFGLTVTEAMWKTKPVIGSSAGGIKLQIRDEMDGLIVHDPKDPIEIAITLNKALSQPKDREVWSYNAQKRVIENFLIFVQIRKWLQLFAET
ncbi:MAG: glycosyltransferase [Cytophagaceae bacterium]